MKQLRVERFNNMDTVVKITVLESGVPTGVMTRGGMMTAKSHRDAARDLGDDFTPDDVRNAVTAFRAAGGVEPSDYTVSQQVAEAPAMLFYLRGDTTPNAQARTFTTLRDVLQEPGTSADLIEWGRHDDAMTQCCAVDVDWHNEPSRYHDCHYQQFVGSVTPRPAFAWITRNRGLRLVYTGPQADLRAAVAAVRAAERFTEGTTGVELKTETRHPGDASVMVADQDTDIACVWPRSSSTDEAVDEDAWRAWLGAHDLTTGRFPHDRCLINPHHESQSPTPVEVRPNGVMCHSCGGRTGHGWLSAGHLLRGENVVACVSPLETIVKNITHYEHAKYILTEHIPSIVPDQISKLYYKALLIAWHGLNDSRIDSAFRERDLIRFRGFWCTTRGEKRDNSNVRVTVSNLPACRDVNGDVNAERVEKFTDCLDLVDDGYPAIQPVFGCRIGTRFPDAEGRDRSPRMVIPNAKHSQRPSYVTPARRMPRDEAWGVMREVYPGIDIDLVEMLIYSRGIIERGCPSLHPKFLFDGVSGSGKTSTPHIAAAICGDRCTDVVAVSDDERLGQKIHEAMRVGSFVVVDEVIKSAKKARVDPRTFLTFILNLSPESSVHALYIGQVRYGWLPVLCLTDTDYPDDVLADEQLGRRLLYRHLGTERQKWEHSTRRAGLAHWGDPRSAGGRVQAACDAILSHVTDRYFKSTPPDLIDVAEQLGFKFLNADGHAERRKLQLRDLFVAWKSYVTPATYGAEPGCRRFDANDSSDLARIWSRLHDEGNPCAWTRINERSWSQATGHPRPLRARVEPFRRGNNSIVSLRFEEQMDGVWTPVT